MKEVQCKTHGSGFQTFVCQHLLANPAQKWFSGEAHETDRWPDAWCAACNEFFLQNGEWTAKNEANITIKLICHHCYEAMKRQEPSPN